ncbi:sensor histidine kinase [Streptomyces harbinensis]|uniref:sensor histidine kinase n=1 Tax=Streptomyces TaxID=1883 RepID=UPI000688E173|nr:MULTISPECIES: ATP-binding protein [Streptomyces]QKV71755.1 sensor histidine kinase [Streptomyces harbinensis]
MPEPRSQRALTGSGRTAAAAPPRPHPERGRLLRLAVLPAALVAAIAVAAVLAVQRLSQPVPLLIAAALGAAAVLAGAVAVATGEARLQAARHAALGRRLARHRAELATLATRPARRRDSGAAAGGTAPAPEPFPDSLAALGHEIDTHLRAAEDAVARARALPPGGAPGSDEKIAVFVNLARRMQTFVHRQLEHLDELEHEVEDPDLLKGLFHIDHLATRIRRHAENLAVLGGAVSRRQWTRPVALTEVLRSCIAEVEQYTRVKLVPPIEGTVRGHAVADVIHLLAELVENATLYSAPQTRVLLRVQRVTAGLAIEVEDRGLGMTDAEQSRMNAVLAGAEPMDVAELLEDGRVGLFVVSTLARRHNIVVQLQSNIYGGVQAVLVLPEDLLGDESEGQFVPGPPRHRHIPAEPVVPATVTTRAAPPMCSAPPVRPQLPRRRRQQHLVPQLRDITPPAPGLAASLAVERDPDHDRKADRTRDHDRDRDHEPTLRHEPDSEPDPGLMAAFRRGTSLADDTDDTD